MQMLRWPSLVECCFTSIESVSLLGTGAQDGHLDFNTAPELCGRPGLPVPNKPCGFCGRKAALNRVWAQSSGAV